MRIIPWEERMLRYSSVSVSKLKEASMRRRVRSAVLATHTVEVVGTFNESLSSVFAWISYVK
jgi:hypothetical protein